MMAQDIRGGLNTRVKRGHGIRIEGPHLEDWAHPWRCIPFWKNEWCAGVTPGFINGYPPVIPMSAVPLKEQGTTRFPKDNRDFGLNPLTGETYTPLMITPHGAKQDIFITDEAGPYLINTGFFNPLLAGVAQQSDGSALVTAGSYPAFFKRMVKPPQSAAEVNAALGNESTTTVTFGGLNTNKQGKSELRSFDIVLRAEHGAIKSDNYLSDPLTGTATITTPAFTASPTRFPFRLYTTSKFTGSQPYPDILQRLQGDLTEPTWDDLKIATVWLVSPENADPSSKPDETWSPFVQHFVFWNLGYTQANYVANTPYDPITINVPIGLGLASEVGNVFLAPLNQALQDAANALNLTSTKGSFWTV
jgi:hypothetical protein